MGRANSSSSSSIESSNCNHPLLSTASSFSHPNTDLSTDLSLGLSISKEVAAEGNYSDEWNQANLFVKVYMEGIPIGRKLDLLAHNGYQDLIRTLNHMFSTSIFRAEEDKGLYHKFHVLTYEDQEGDWMMVGDVPWEMFLSTVKRLRITKADS